MKHRHFFLRGVVVSAALVVPAVAQAQSADKPSAAAGSPVSQAREHFQRGVKLYEEDDFRTALIEFKRAYELSPNATLLFNIGNSYYQLREYADALRALEQYVREVGSAIPKDAKVQVDREVEDLRGRVAHVTFQSNVAGAELAMDETKVGTLPLAQNQIVSAGRHRLELTKPGYKTLIKDVDIAGGDNVSIPFDLKAEDTSSAVAAAPVEKPNHTASIVVLSVGLAGIVVGTVGGIAALSSKSNLNDQCSGKTCPRSSQSDVDAFSRNGVISTIGFSVGAAALVAGGLLFWWESSKAHGSTRTGSNKWLTVRPGGAGLVAQF